MCTLLFALDVLGPRTLLIATNRDEDPARPSEPPQRLREDPLLVGGRDARAGGTWLALRAPARDRPAGVAMLLNRHDPHPERTGRRSRGLLTIDVAAAADPGATADAEAATGRYAPCTLVWLSPNESSWILALREGREPERMAITPGWHALAHHELDDPGDPRTAWLAGQLAGFVAQSPTEGFDRLTALLSTHGGDARPAVCIHEGRAPTVSAAQIGIGPWGLTYRHAPGAPCVTPFEDCAALAAGHPLTRQDA